MLLPSPPPQLPAPPRPEYLDPDPGPDPVPAVEVGGSENGDDMVDNCGMPAAVVAEEEVEEVEEATKFPAPPRPDREYPPPEKGEDCDALGAVLLLSCGCSTIAGCAADFCASRS
jgi:hypothetical protein